MVYLRYLSGPHKGRKRNVTDADPEIIFRNMLEFGWDWSIDYSKATKEKVSIWWGFDVGARIRRALAYGRTVYFMGYAYEVRDPDEFETVAREVVDCINRAAHTIGIERDDECGLVINAYISLN